MNKKKFLGVAALAMAVSMTVGLTACGGTGNTDNTGGTGGTGGEGGTTTPPATTITYQYTGNFTNETLTGFGFDYYIMLNLYSDNKIAGSGYNSLTMDSRKASENTGFGEKWFKGLWEETKDEENQECIKLTVMYDADAKNGMTGAPLSNTSEYYVYKTSTGSLGDFKLQSPIFSGTTEYMTDMKLNATPYQTADAFIQANLYTWSAPADYKALFETTSDSQMNSKIYLFDDGTAKVYDGKNVPGTTDYKYMPKSEWTWSKSDGKISFVDGDTTHEATISGTTATLEYTLSVMGNDMSYKYSCADVSKLGEGSTTTPETPEEKTVVATLTAAEGGYTATFYDDNTVKLTTMAPQLSPEWKWTCSNGTITLTETTGTSSPNGVTITVENGVATLTYAPAFLQGSSIVYTGDISVITKQVVATLTAAEGGYTATFYDNNTVKLTTMAPQLSPEWKWAYADSAITLTEMTGTSSPNGVTITIENGVATLTYAPAFLQGASIVYTGSVTAITGSASSNA